MSISFFVTHTHRHTYTHTRIFSLDNIIIRRHVLICVHSSVSNYVNLITLGSFGCQPGEYMSLSSYPVHPVLPSFDLLT